MEDADLRVDGNAVAGLLREVFAVELSAARVRCAHCGAVAEVGAEPAYVQAPGTVVRCRICSREVLVLVRGGGRYVLSLAGAAWLEIPEPLP